MLDINGALKAIGYGLLVLFFAVGVVKTCGSFTDVKRPEHALKLFIRFALAKAAVTYGLDLMLAVFKNRTRNHFHHYYPIGFVRKQRHHTPAGNHR